MTPTIADIIGFTATKSFRAARRAMRPAIGDTMVTRRNGVLLTARVCRLEGESIYWERIREGMEDWPETCVAESLRSWRRITVKALRIGAEFKPTPTPP